MKSIDSIQDIQDTARGAVFLGAGGGATRTWESSSCAVN